MLIVFLRNSQRQRALGAVNLAHRGSHGNRSARVRSDDCCGWFVPASCARPALTRQNGSSTYFSTTKHLEAAPLILMLLEFIGGSSNGRTADSDSVNQGSNPCPPAKRFSRLSRIFICSLIRFAGVLRDPSWITPRRTTNSGCRPSCPHTPFDASISLPSSAAE